MSLDQELLRARQHLREGNLHDAERILEPILAADPDHAETLHNLGIIALRRGELDQAADFLGRAAQLDPSVSQYHLNAGIVLQKQGKYHQAEEAYRAAIALAPDFAPNHYNLGLMFQHQERFAEAEFAYCRALELDAGYVPAYGNLGVLLQLQDRWKEAAAVYRQALDLAPNDHALHYNLGAVLEKLRCVEEAEAAYRRVIQLEPDCAEALLGLGTLLRRQSRIREAEPYAKRALELLPDDVDALGNYAYCHRFQPGDPVTKKLQALASTDLPPDDRRILLGALGKAQDDVGDYEQAFGYYRQANELHAAAPFDVSSIRRQVDDVKHAFRERSLCTAKRESDKFPIFVVGMSRSGKTLVESLLSQHPAVYGTGERGDWKRAIEQVLQELSIEKEFPAYVRQLTESQLQRIAETYFECVSQYSSEPRLYVNTIPSYFVYIGLIFRCFPQAKVIHCFRHPIDNCLFMYFRQYRQGHEYSKDLNELVQFYKCYQDLMRYWKDLYADRILDVSYEQLVMNPRQTASQVYKYAGLELDPNRFQSDFHADEIGRWRHYRSLIGPLCDAFQEGSQTHS